MFSVPLPTISKASDTYSQAREGRQLELNLECLDIGLSSLKPGLAYSINPFGTKALDIRPFLRNIFVFRCVGITYNQVRDVGGEIELMVSAHLRCDGGELRLG